MAAIAERVQAVRERLRQLRPEDPPTLMAVSKGQPWDRIAEAMAAGVHLFGENRVQEVRQKWQHRPPEVALHLIGHLQRNKAGWALRLCDGIDSVDSDRLAETLHRLLGDRKDPYPVMVEVNPGREPQKHGLLPEAVRPFLAGQGGGRLRYVGLMAVLPRPRDASAAEAAKIRHLMQETARLWRMCRSEGWPWAPLTELSMGMSGDYEWAVEAGATMVRLGEAIFGPRPPVADGDDPQPSGARTREAQA
jgi:pyridoxal phosphate enzyme (YggS family)